MAAKKEKDKDKYDEVIIETTQLKIDIKTTGDLITKEYDLLPFHPNMAELRDLSNNHYILFPSFIKITMKDLKRAGAGEDYPKIFMNLEKYIKLIKYVTGPDHEADYTLFIDRADVKNYATSLLQNSLTDLISDENSNSIVIQKYEEPTKEEIITNNIELIKNVFLPVKSHFFILGNDYVIGKSKYIGPPKRSADENTKLVGEHIPLTFTVKFELQLLDAANNPDAGNFSRLSCSAKKANIAKDALDIFGTNFGYKPVIKASTPSILNTSTATQNRKFGKLQKEWEERNKYVKAPTNERERLAIENNWTPLQRKMADLEKDQVKFDKIPPMWIKETTDSKDKFIRFETAMNNLFKEYTTNTDKKDYIIDKMKALVFPVLENKLEKPPDYTNKPTLIDYNKISDETEFNKELKTFINNAQENEEATIDYKYIKPLLEESGINGKQRDLAELNSRVDNIKTKLNAATSEYEKKSINVELFKVTDERVKKLAEIRKIQDDFGEGYGNEPTEDRKINYKKKIREWKTVITERESKLKALNEEKSIGEKKIKIANVNAEMDTKYKEIVELKKTLLLAKFYEGDYYGLSKTDRESYEKKSSKDRPLESVDTLKSNLKTAKDQYLEIAAKFSPYNKVQAEITLLNNDLTEFKTLKESWKKERDAKEKEISGKNADIGTIKKAAENNVINGVRGVLKPEEKTKVDAINKQIDIIQKEIDEKINPFYEPADENYKLYTRYIDELKKIKQDSKTADITDKEKSLKTTFENLRKKLFEPAFDTTGQNKLKKRIDLTGVPKEIDDDGLIKNRTIIKNMTADIIGNWNDGKDDAEEKKEISDEVKKILQKAVEAAQIAVDNKPNDTTLVANLQKAKDALAANPSEVIKEQARDSIIEKIKKKTEKEIKTLNDEYEKLLKDFAAAGASKGGKLLRRTRKRSRSRRRRHSSRMHKKQSRYIVTKYKILKKSSRSRQRRRRKYTLRKN